MFASLATLARSQLEKWFPLWGERTHSLICMYVNRKEEEEGETEQNYRAINLPIVI